MWEKKTFYHQTENAIRGLLQITVQNTRLVKCKIQKAKKKKREKAL